MTRLVLLYEAPEPGRAESSVWMEYFINSKRNKKELTETRDASRRKSMRILEYISKSS